MISQDQLHTIIGATAYDRDGDKLGKIGQVYFDDDTDQPRWITVNTGLFGTNESFVPVQGLDTAGASEDRVTLGFDKATIKDAPNIAEDGHLTPDEEQALYRHYGVSYGGTDTYDDTSTYTDTTRTETTRTEATTTTGVAGGVDRDADLDRNVDRDRDGAVGYDTSGPTTDNAMTRSEERLRVGTETQETGRARLRKYVVTEHQQVQVPVSHEEVRIEREPITDANRGDAHEGPEISEEEHEVVLRAERPVVDTEVEAVERVRLGTETVRDTETVGGEVRKEEIELVDDTTDTTDTTTTRRDDR